MISIVVALGLAAGAHAAEQTPYQRLLHVFTTDGTVNYKLRVFVEDCDTINPSKPPESFQNIEFLVDAGEIDAVCAGIEPRPLAGAADLPGFSNNGGDKLMVASCHQTSAASNDCDISEALKNALHVAINLERTKRDAQVTKDAALEVGAQRDLIGLSEESIIDSAVIAPRGPASPAQEILFDIFRKNLTDEYDQNVIRLCNATIEDFTSDKNKECQLKIEANGITAPGVAERNVALAPADELAKRGILIDPTNQTLGLNRGEGEFPRDLNLAFKSLILWARTEHDKRDLAEYREKLKDSAAKAQIAYEAAQKAFDAACNLDHGRTDGWRKTCVQSDRAHLGDWADQSGSMSDLRR